MKAVKFRRGKGGCHNCTSHHIGTHGYPNVHQDGRNQNLHRVLYELKFGKLKRGLVVRHRCDNRRCVNLKHLVVGTQADNTADITKRNRHNPPIGERSGSAKLTKRDVLSIRKSCLTQAALAKKYGVTSSTINRIVKRVHWRHV